MRIKVHFEDNELLSKWLAKHSATLIRETYVGDGLSIAHIDGSPFTHDVWVDRDGKEFHVVEAPIAGLSGATTSRRGEAFLPN